MSVFTAVTLDDLRAWLGNYSLGEPLSLEGIAAGIENTNYFVTTDRGRYVLTLFEKLSAAELPFYLNLMAHLAEHDIPCPHPYADRRGEYLGELNGKPAVLVTCLPGKDVEHPSSEQCARVGELLARMHLAARSYPAAMENPRGPHWWKATAPSVLPFLSQEDAALLTEELRFQSLYRLADLARGVIHADLFRDNVLFDGGKVSGVIDFYFACTDALLFDVAITVNDWCIAEDGKLDPERAQALLAAYHRLRPFTAIERGAWPVLLRAGALRFWVSRLQDFHLPRPGELTFAKDPEHFRRILARHASSHAELARLWPQLG
ncbi:MAG: homoserine kinase [Betaproteobacteria bacterium]|nr:homoserine kinase [Betaproteobacteria bacterium]